MSTSSLHRAHGPDPCDDDLLRNAGWPRLADRILAGSCHDLNGRSSALYGLSELVRSGEDAEFVAEALTTEARRVQDLAAALRTLSARTPDDPAPLSLGERLPGVAALFSLQPGAEQVPVEIVADPGASAAFAPWRSLCRSILLAMNVVASGVLQRSGGGSVRLSVAQGVEGPVLRIDGVTNGEDRRCDPAAAELRDQFSAWPDQLEGALATWGGQASYQPVPDDEGAGPRVEVRLPRPSSRV